MCENAASANPVLCGLYVVVIHTVDMYKTAGGRAEDFNRKPRTTYNNLISSDTNRRSSIESVFTLASFVESLEEHSVRPI